MKIVAGETEFLRSESEIERLEAEDPDSEWLESVRWEQNLLCPLCRAPIAHFPRHADEWRFNPSAAGSMCRHVKFTVEDSFGEWEVLVFNDLSQDGFQALVEPARKKHEEETAALAASLGESAATWPKWNPGMLSAADWAQIPSTDKVDIVLRWIPVPRGSIESETYVVSVGFGGGRSWAAESGQQNVEPQVGKIAEADAGPNK